MPDFEIVHRMIVRSDDPYLTADRLRAAIESQPVNFDALVMPALDGHVKVGYTVVAVNPIAVRKVSQ